MNGSTPQTVRFLAVGKELFILCTMSCSSVWRGQPGHGGAGGTSGEGDQGGGATPYPQGGPGALPSTRETGRRMEDRLGSKPLPPKKVCTCNIEGALLLAGGVHDPGGGPELF